jgi:formamidopyrimidine-DNA glycosylase
MPELAEVDYFRRQWNPGLGHRVTRIEMHAGKGVFRGINRSLFKRTLCGTQLTASEARGKQMVFRFGNGAWLGVHLGMTGSLSVAGPDHRSGKHDHLVLFQASRALVFNDPRLFGRLLFDPGPEVPSWWNELPPALTSREFTPAALADYLRRHARAPLKAVLLQQERFPGVGNWMADEILWRARLHPALPAGGLNSQTVPHLWRVIREVCRGAMKHVAPAFDDPPQGWLCNERWNGKGRCPRDATPLRREPIGGRTTAWCPRCQPPGSRSANLRAHTKRR